MNLVVARSMQTKAIGKNNKLLWKLKDDMRFFKTITTDKNVVMGRRTYQSIGKPLPKRNNIILSRALKPVKEKNFQIINDHTEILNLKDVFIIGGEQIYDLFSHYCRNIFVTEVDSSTMGDTHFNFNESKYTKELLKSFKKSKRNEFSFKIYRYYLR